MKSQSLGNTVSLKTVFPKSAQVQQSAIQSHFSNLRLLLTPWITMNIQAHCRPHSSLILCVVSVIFHDEALRFLRRTITYGQAHFGCRLAQGKWTDRDGLFCNGRRHAPAIWHSVYPLHRGTSEVEFGLLSPPPSPLPSLLRSVDKENNYGQF